MIKKHVLESMPVAQKWVLTLLHTGQEELGRLPPFMLKTEYQHLSGITFQGRVVAKDYPVVWKAKKPEQWSQWLSESRDVPYGDV